MINLTFEEAVKKADALKAIDQTTIYLRDGEYPWRFAERVEASGAYRFSGPIGMYVIAEVDGLTFKWSVDFERREANGHGYSLFDRERLRDVAMKLPIKARKSFANLLRDAVMPDLEKRTAELRAAMNRQIDSEDCVRGLIAFADAA